MDGVERVRAQNRRRYYERIARMKATGEYEAFKAKKTAEGMRRLSEEKRNENQRKNRLLNKAWIERTEGGGDLQGLQTTLECAAAGESGCQKTSHGCGGVESPPETEIY